MTYDIPYGAATYSSVPWPLFACLTFLVALVLTVVIHSLADGRRKRTILFTALGLVTALAVTWFVLADASDRAAREHDKERRIDRIARAWQLNTTDAAYLLSNAYSPGGLFNDAPDSDAAFVTIGGESAKAYLQIQGERIRLIVDDQAVPVGTR